MRWYFNWLFPSCPSHYRHQYSCASTTIDWSVHEWEMFPNIRVFSLLKTVRHWSTIRTVLLWFRQQSQWSVDKFLNSFFSLHFYWDKYHMCLALFYIVHEQRWLRPVVQKNIKNFLFGTLGTWCPYSFVWCLRPSGRNLGDCCFT